MIKLSLREKKTVETALHLLVLALSLGLIVYISVDTFTGVHFMEDKHFLDFQLWLCLAFVADFFIELWLADNKADYVRRRWIFLVLSIPYLNIINLWHLNFSPEALYFIRFIPLARGALAMSIVIGYMTNNAITSLLFSYLAIMIAAIYFASLIFFEREQPVNPLIPNYWSALWWAAMDATTIGSYINPVTVVGKILGVVLAAMGMMMFPLFTVYITSWVQRYNSRHTSSLLGSLLTSGDRADDKKKSAVALSENAG